MSGWKTVKKKKKKGGGGGRRDDDYPSFNTNQNQHKKKKKQTKKKPAITQKRVRNLPLGSSGAPKLANKIKQQQGMGRNQGGGKKKKYTNERKVTVKKKQGWFDPNQLYEAGDDDGYYYHGKDTSQYITQDLADKIRRNRDKVGLSRKEFAQSINEDLSLVTKYEMCQTVPNQKVLQKMSRVLKVNLGRAGKTRKKKEKSHFYKRD